MAQAQFPEPKDLNLPTTLTAGDGTNHMVHTQYTLDNPHPGFGKDPNVINHLGHTKYPKWVKNSIGENVVVHNAEEEEALKEEKVELKHDGPTIQEFVKAGFKAKDYPPAGYASRSTEAEIKAALDAAAGWGTNK